MHKANKINIIFDLDQTLIQSIFNFDVNIKVPKNTHSVKLNLKDEQFILFFRRHVNDLLNYCFDNFNVGFWSVGNVGYVNTVLDNLISEKHKNKINLILARLDIKKTHCIYQNQLTKKKYKVNRYNYQTVKSLDLLFEHKDFKHIFKKKNTILIDDSAYNISVNKYNSIQIPQFCYNKQDNILLELIKWFKKIKNTKNIQNNNIEFYNYNGKSFICA